MATLNGALSIATRALLAEQGAMQATTNNLANVNTPGYCRELPILSAEDPIVSGSLTYGNGVTLQGYRSLRDRILDLRISEETQGESRMQSFISAMNQVQVLFSDPNGGIGGALSKFFNSLAALSSQADSQSLRQNVLASAQNLAGAFREASNNISSLQAGLDLQVDQNVNEVNRLSSVIARLNQRIADLQKVGQEPGTLVDQRQQTIANLSQIVDVEQTRTDEGLTLTTANGVALVVDGQSFALHSAVDSSTSLHRIFAGTVDITDKLSKGALGGILAVREQAVPQLQSQLDTLAAAISDAVNAVHQTGIDRNGNPGGLIFSVPPAGGVGAAALMSVLLTDPATLAMSATTASGGNEIANQLLVLKDQQLVGSQTATGAYAQIVFYVGSQIADAQTSLDATSSVLQQLQDQQSALSGVSIDEETANLLQFQRGFEAAAHVISVLDSMMQTILNMGVTR